jgi:TrmH family RNA methyltransferase
LLTAEERARVEVVLVRARNPNNIGAVARAMHDFGFARMAIVSDYLVPFEAARSAVDAADVLAGAMTNASVAEAVRACTLVLGTTAVGERAVEHPVLTLKDAAERIGEHVKGNAGHRVALLFGSEKTGLSNAEMSHCHALVTIPMERYTGVRHPSMNLGQAVAVCLYEMVRERSLERVVTDPARATAEEMERLRGLLVEVLEASGYTRRHPANSEETQVRRLLLRGVPTAADAPVWTGVLRQVLWALRRAKRERSDGGDSGFTGDA